MKFKTLITASAVVLLTAFMLGYTHKQANALTFTFKLLRLQKITFNVQKLKLTDVYKIGFNKALMLKQIGLKPIVLSDCAHEYERCRGLIDQFDDTMEHLLLTAKNVCIYSGESPQEECFGLDIEIPEEDNTSNVVIIETPQLQCTGPHSRACTDPDGHSGTQIAVSCNTGTGEWNFDECVVTKPSVNICLEKHGTGYRLCTASNGKSGEQYASYCNTATEQWVWKTCIPFETEPQCEGTQPSCPSGYTGSYYCSNGTWVNGCKAPPPPSCQGAPPLCQEGYTGGYSCINGNWVSQCQKVETCPVQEPDWRVCIMSDGRYGREYTDYCNETTKEWAWRTCNVYINLQPTCTSFTYTDWNTCSSGNQGRTVVTRAPYGCAGGNPVTYQTCCSGAEPSCPNGWSGSYTCSNNNWYNTCVPLGSELCYRGVKYKNVTIGTPAAYAQCAGSGHYVNGKFCLDNICSNLQAWNNYGAESNFKKYIDDIYSQTVPNSCNPSFKYTQCN
jgi:hypothetical protein